MLQERARGDTANRAYGATATDWAGRLPDTLPLVATDIGSLPQAFAEAARRRKRGAAFLGSVLMDDARARCALFVAAPPSLAQMTDYDDRWRMLDAIAERGLVLGGKAQHEFERLDPRYVRAAIEFLTTADTVAVRSTVERERLCTTLGQRFLHLVVAAPLDANVPPPRPGLPRSACSIVVWAPHLPAEACGIFAFALEEFRRPAVIVCAAGQPAKMRAQTRFVRIAQAAEALADAAVIVDTTLSDPGTTRALARWGVPLASASTAGALDVLDGVTVYDPWSHRSIHTAVVNALGYRAPRERRLGDDAAALSDALHWAAPVVPVAGPLVSVVVPTVNRRASLDAAVASIAAQTYPHVEIVIVNDGGPPIEPARFSAGHVRLVEYAENCGVIEALNGGIAAATGKYIALLADDDLFCPDHLARLVAPLERTGDEVAHSIELGEHFECRADGMPEPIGHSLIAGRPVTPTSLQVWNFIGGPSILFTRSAFEHVGPFDARAGHLCDLEMWLRLSLRYDIVHVERVTAVMSMRDDASQLSAISGVDTAAYYRTIYNLHPSTRVAVKAAREQHLRDVEAIPIVRTLPQLRLGA